jgi:hypothetical protein
MLPQSAFGRVTGSYGWDRQHAVSAACETNGATRRTAYIGDLGGTETQIKTGFCQKKLRMPHAR